MTAIAATDLLGSSSVAGSGGVRSTGRSDFTALAAQVQTAGLMRRRYGYYWAKLVLLPLVLVATIVAFVWIGNSWWQLFTALAFAVIFTQKHTRHHANPNKEGSDPDIELPVISFTPEQASRRRNAVTNWTVSHQGAFFFPILLLEGISRHASGINNYQIEHHLFPSMARPHLRRAALIVREYCQRLGVPYTETGLFESYAIVQRYINRVGLGERDPFDCPLVAQRRSL